MKGNASLEKESSDNIVTSPIATSNHAPRWPGRQRPTRTPASTATAPAKITGTTSYAGGGTGRLWAASTDIVMATTTPTPIVSTWTSGVIDARGLTVVVICPCSCSRPGTARGSTPILARLPARRDDGEKDRLAQ